jgi:hypothetical protein
VGARVCTFVACVLLQARYTAGTLVTPQTFEAWKVKFEEEMAPMRLEIRKRNQTSSEGRMTGESFRLQLLFAQCDGSGSCAGDDGGDDGARVCVCVRACVCVCVTHVLRCLCQALTAIPVPLAG